LFVFFCLLQWLHKYLHFLLLNWNNWVDRVKRYLELLVFLFLTRKNHLDIIPLESMLRCFRFSACLEVTDKLFPSLYSVFWASLLRMIVFVLAFRNWWKVEYLCKYTFIFSCIFSLNLIISPLYERVPTPFCELLYFAE